MARFALDAEQTDAILELKIYRLARLEILVITNELAEKRKRARQIAACSSSEAGPLDARARRDRRDPEDVRRPKTTRGAPRSPPTTPTSRVHRRRLHRRGRQRRHRVARRLGEAAEGSEGPVARRACAKATRCWRCCRAARARRWCSSRISARPTRAASSTCRRRPATASRSRSCSSSRTASAIVGAFSLDPRDRRATSRRRQRRRRPPVHAVAVTSDGYSLRFSLEAFVEPSTRAGRRYARPCRRRRSGGRRDDHGRRDGHRRHRDARAMLCKVEEVNFLSGPGRGVILIKLRRTTTACSASSPRPATATC